MLSKSLRFRLMVFILVPFTFATVIMVFWRFQEAENTATNVFNNNLTVLAWAISKDVAEGNPDYLSHATRDLIDQSSGGRIYYHAKGPDGSFITGYAYPPRIPKNNQSLSIYETSHQDIKVRAIQLKEIRTIDGIRGEMIITVWQQLSDYENYAFNLALSSAYGISVLLISLLLIIYFAIYFGMKPLLTLEDAIEKRSYNDLSTIKRDVPIEVKGIVVRLNSLFNRLSDAIKGHDRFISNAAHQLRNPIAAILASAEAAKEAPSEKDLHMRVERILDTAQYTSRLTHQLLSLDKLTQNKHIIHFDKKNIVETIKGASLRLAPTVLEQDIKFSFEADKNDFHFPHNSVLIGQVIENLIDNAFSHGGDSLSSISIDITTTPQQITIQVSNDGAHIDEEINDTLFERFEQGRHSQGSGLGLAIAYEIIKQHKGHIHASNEQDQVSFSIHFS